MKVINNKLIEETVKAARASPRKRHTTEISVHKDVVQRLINAVEPESYVRPHMHESPGKTETFLILKGKMAVLIFDEEGNVKNIFKIETGGENLAVDILPGTWHSLVSLESGSVVFEARSGPYNPNGDKKFPGWAPEEGTEEGQKYLTELKKKIEAV